MTRRDALKAAAATAVLGLAGATGWTAANLQRGIVKPTTADTIRGAVYADNWFALYVNGKLVAVDPIDFLPHNVVPVELLPEYPMTIAIIAKDNADPKTGYEYGNQIGDAGIALKFADGTVTNAKWKVKRVFSGPPVKNEPIPVGWEQPGFDDKGWANATEYTVERVDPKKPYYDADFEGAKFIWTDDLDRDNTILLRTTVDRPGWKPRWNTKPDLDTRIFQLKG
jgi:hypothetical protein